MIRVALESRVTNEIIEGIIGGKLCGRVFVGVVVQEAAKEAEGPMPVEEFRVKEVVSGDDKGMRFVEKISFGGNEVALEDSQGLFAGEPCAQGPEGILAEAIDRFRLLPGGRREHKIDIESV